MAAVIPEAIISDAPPQSPQRLPNDDDAPCGSEISSEDSSHLDPGKVSVEKPPPDSITSDFRFRHHLHERHKLLDALPLLSLTPKQRDRFVSCGSDAWIQFSQASGRYRVVATSCKLKWCPYCARSRSKKIEDAISRLLATAPRNDWRFLTLTARHTAEPLAVQLENLKKSFRRMRQRKAWKTHVNYGIGVIETTWNPQTKRWHPHIHLLITGAYFPKALIRSEWLCATRNSFIIDIRSLFDTASAASYIAKYLGKPPSNAILQDILLLDEWIIANTASKRVIRFGKAPETEPPPEKDDGLNDWEPVHKLIDVINKANRGDIYSKRVLEILQENDREQDQPDNQNAKPP